jgi:hypothetical protein
VNSGAPEGKAILRFIYSFLFIQDDHQVTKTEFDTDWVTTFAIGLCPFSFVIVLTVLLQFMASDYPFGIFKLFSGKYFVSNVLLKRISTYLV